MKKLPLILIIMAFSPVTYLNAHAKDGWSIFATIGLGEKGESTDSNTYSGGTGEYSDNTNGTTKTDSDPMNQVFGVQYRQGRNAFEVHQFSTTYDITTTDNAIFVYNNEEISSYTDNTDVEFSGTTLAYVYFPDNGASKLQPFFKFGRTSYDSIAKGTSNRNGYYRDTDNRDYNGSGVGNLLAGGFEYAADDAVSLIVGVSFYGTDYTFTDIGVKYSF